MKTFVCAVGLLAAVSQSSGLELTDVSTTGPESDHHGRPGGKPHHHPHHHPTEAPGGPGGKPHPHHKPTQEPHKPTQEPHDHKTSTEAPDRPGGQAGSITTFHWNIHYQCGQDDRKCTADGLQKFGELVKEAGADIAVAIELRGASSALHGWSASGEFRDAVSVMVKPGWKVEKKGGGQIVSGSGARGVAVMLVTPPHAVKGCPKLCVMGVHPGHSPIKGGQNIVHGVCGADVAEKCSIATGDWNADAGQLRGGNFHSWSALIGGTPSLIAPNEGTCCHPRSGAKYDHAGTNIVGATQGRVKVWDFQMVDKYKMAEEHKPVSVQMNMPGAADLTNSSEVVV